MSKLGQEIQSFKGGLSSYLNLRSRNLPAALQPLRELEQWVKGQQEIDHVGVIPV